MQTASGIVSSPQSELLLSSLREGTRDLHERIERRLNLPARLATQGGYTTLLERFYGFYEPLEKSLAEESDTPWMALGLSYANRRKTGFLESDLTFLGLDSASLAGLNRCPSELLPPVDSIAALIGCCYVIEGSTLGGQVIGRMVETSLGLRPGSPGTRFFTGYGSQTGRMWRQFRRAAEEYVARADATDQGDRNCITTLAVASARSMFASMEIWLIPESSPASQ